MLKKYFQPLFSKEFIKPTSSNINHVVRYNKAIELTNGEKLPVSFRKEEKFINANLQNY